MAADYEIHIVPSVLDRLIDLEPKSSRDAADTRADTVRALRLAVARDLDALLNSRNTFGDLSTDFVEARRSVLTYGFPDLTTMNLSLEVNQQRLAHAIETTIRTFEPRLTGVVVTVPKPLDGSSPNPARSLRIRMDARLVMDPSPEAIAFDIVPVRSSGKYEVKERE